MAYAIVRTGGKQHRVTQGARLTVDRLKAEVGAELTLGEVLLMGGEGDTQVGAPTVAGATVKARIVAHQRGDKILVFKKNRRKLYHKMMGHRQELTSIEITSIGG